MNLSIIGPLQNCPHNFYNNHQTAILYKYLYNLNALPPAFKVPVFPSYQPPPRHLISHQYHVVLIHRLINQAEAPDNLKSLIEYRADVSERTTRASSDSVLNTRRCRLEATRRTVPVRPIQTWNGLPSELRQIGSSGAFKKRLNAALAQRP